MSEGISNNVIQKTKWEERKDNFSTFFKGFLSGVLVTVVIGVIVLFIVR